MTGGNRGLWTLRVPEAAKHYPCAKTAWVEFLGEHPNSPIDRVEKPA